MYAHIFIQESEMNFITEFTNGNVTRYAIMEDGQRHRNTQLMHQNKWTYQYILSIC